MTSCWLAALFVEQRFERLVVRDAEEPAARRASVRKARSVIGSSSQRLAYHEAKPVVSPFGASTSIQCSPLVTRPRRTPVAWSSSIIRVAGDAFQCFPATALSKSCPSGYVWISSRALPAWPALRVLHDRIGPQDFAVLGDGRLERLGDGLAFGEHFIGQAEGLLQHELDPCPVDGRVRSVAALILLPLVVGQPQMAEMLGIVGVEPLREHPHQHGHRQERPGDLDQREPFGMVVFRGHMPVQLRVELLNNLQH